MEFFHFFFLCATVVIPESHYTRSVLSCRSLPPPPVFCVVAPFLPFPFRWYTSLACGLRTLIFLFQVFLLSPVLVFPAYAPIILVFCCRGAVHTLCSRCRLKTFSDPCVKGLIFASPFQPSAFFWFSSGRFTGCMFDA